MISEHIFPEEYGGLWNEVRTLIEEEKEEEGRLDAFGDEKKYDNAVKELLLQQMPGLKPEEIGYQAPRAQTLPLFSSTSGHGDNIIQEAEDPTPRQTQQHLHGVDASGVVLEKTGEMVRPRFYIHPEELKDLVPRP